MALDEELEDGAPDEKPEDVSCGRPSTFPVAAWDRASGRPPSWRGCCSPFGPPPTMQPCLCCCLACWPELPVVETALGIAHDSARPHIEEELADEGEDSPSAAEDTTPKSPSGSVDPCAPSGQAECGLCRRVRFTDSADKDVVRFCAAAEAAKPGAAAAAAAAQDCCCAIAPASNESSASCASTQRWSSAKRRCRSRSCGRATRVPPRLGEATLWTDRLRGAGPSRSPPPPEAKAVVAAPALLPCCCWGRLGGPCPMARAQIRASR